MVAALISLAAMPAAALTDPVTVVRPAPVVAPSAIPAARRDMNRRVFDRVWDEVRRAYYDPHLHGVDWTGARAAYRAEALAASDDATLYRVLDRMLGLLDDSHARAVSPAVARRQDNLRIRRPVLGVTLNPERDGDYRVERVRVGSPAEVAGIRVGWRLKSGDRGWTPELELTDGVPLTLDFTDDAGLVRAIALTPRLMDPQPPFVADASRDGVLVLRVEGFEPGLGDWMGARLAEVSPDTEIVIDLRGNPGGRLLEADAVLSCFLPPDQIWATRTARSGRRVVMRTAGGCGDLRQPVANAVAVLVDANSRSAAELTPAALQEAGRAVVVGEPTAGAVLISQESRLPDGGRLSLSRADFTTSGGVRLEKRGVTPDVTAAQSQEDRTAGRDPALDAAVAALADVEQARAPTPVH